MNRTFKVTVVLFGLLGMTIAVAAETVTYTGTAKSIVNKSTMPLGSGDSVVTAVSRGTAALSSSPPTLVDMDCVGMGLLGAGESYSADFYCSLKENSDNVLDLKGTDGTAGSQFSVTGGSGRWKGATGQGTFKRQMSSETESNSTFELVITTP